MTKIWEEGGCLVIDERNEWAPCPNAKITREWSDRFPDHKAVIKKMICHGWTPITYENGLVLGFFRNTSFGREAKRCGYEII